MFKKAHVAALGTLLSPGLAAACGGLFCNNAQPVNQAAERILFAHDGEQMQMHVRITYQGPPTEFGWLLPVPADVETGLSSETLFTQLDQTFAPVFQLNFEFEGENCFPDAGFPEGGAGGAGGEGGGGGGVQVLSREPVGPYDRSILQAESVDRLLEWLADNDYQVPPGSESTLQPYVDLGAAFVALKLLPGADAADIVPLRLSFSGNTPAVPIRPTAVAAEPDMGVIIQLLGPSRAVSTNYLHVQINEAAIDWAAAGANYADVVSQAADEAGGRAFATDFAGRHADVFFFGTLTPDVVEAISAAATLGDVMRFVDLNDPDVQRIMRSNLVPPEGLTVDDVLIFPFDFTDLPVDGAAIAAAINDEIVEVRAPIIALFERHPYLTRVFTTMSPAEMIDDPVFAFNPDLPDQGRTRTATQVVNCETNDSYLRVGGQRVLRGEPIQRAGGETVRGVEQIGAALIERQYAAGQSEVVEDRRDQIGMGGAGGAGGAGAAGGAGGSGGAGGANNDAGLGQDGGDEGCDCDVSGGGPGLGVLLLGLLGLVRRRR